MQNGCTIRIFSLRSNSVHARASPFEHVQYLTMNLLLCMYSTSPQDSAPVCQRQANERRIARLEAEVKDLRSLVRTMTTRRL